MNAMSKPSSAPEKSLAPPLRVRPYPGQGFSTEMRVECSKTMRTAYSVGQKFSLYAKVTSRLDGPDFLYSSYRDEWNPMSDEGAKKFIKEMFKK